jgi:hypothetical protein
MIKFTDENLYVKGTCNVICEDIENGNVLYQDSKMTTGSINASVSIEEVRSGYGNPVAAVIPTGSDLSVEFEAADFKFWAKTAQIGAEVTYSAPVPVCQTITAEAETLTVDTADGMPVAEQGDYIPRAYIQKVGSESLIATDGTAYSISANGTISDFTAVPGEVYKVWYFIQKATAKRSVIKSFMKPKVVRFTAQIAVFSNVSAEGYQGTRVGWLYYTIPHLQLQGNVSFNGDQKNYDATKIQGIALDYDPYEKSDTCPDVSMGELGYLVYVPNDEYDRIRGLAVVGGVIEMKQDENVRIPVQFVMNDGSLAQPQSYEDFDFELESGGSEYVGLSDDGVLTGLEVGETEVTITYTDSYYDTYTCVINVIVHMRDSESPVVGFGQVGYMILQS